MPGSVANGTLCITYAIGYTVATCFDRKRSSSGQLRTFCLRYRMFRMYKMFLVDLMMTVYGRNMEPQCNLLHTLYYYIDIYLSINQLDAQKFCLTISLFHASICFGHNVLIIRCSKFYYTAYGIITRVGGRHVQRLCTGRPPTECDYTRCCIIQFWPPNDKHMCSKHVEAWNKPTVKQKFCASSWLITEINILRCTVSKTSKYTDTVVYWRYVLYNCYCTTGWLLSKSQWVR